MRLRDFLAILFRNDTKMEANKDRKDAGYLVSFPVQPPKSKSKGKLQGWGYTRKNKSDSKRRRKMAKESRKINRK